MTKKKECKSCGEDSGKKNFCSKCKINYPYKSIQKGSKGRPFNRAEVREKELKKEKKKMWGR
tara:strand:+ start:3279 stop:3464 length:186 start_codon:yes stop_codon:yes gene_type:complete